MTRKDTKSAHPRDQALPLFLAGAGLILLGVVVGLRLLQAGEKASASSSSAQLLQAAAPVVVNYPAPELNLYNLRGEAVGLEDFRGRVVLVNNWATWCPPCRAEMPVLQDFHTDHAGLGFTVLAIESGEAPAEVAAFVDQYGLTFPVLPDPAQSAMAAFKNYNLPSSYVVDREGQVRLAWMGPVNREVLDQYLSPLLEQ
jgi:cytochrome c biogenesis protein CcmG, thiol:disulfide interchange protein DsbE